MLCLHADLEADVIIRFIDCPDAIPETLKHFTILFGQLFLSNVANSESPNIGVADMSMTSPFAVKFDVWHQLSQKRTPPITNNPGTKETIGGHKLRHLQSGSTALITLKAKAPHSLTQSPLPPYAVI